MSDQPDQPNVEKKGFRPFGLPMPLQVLIGIGLGVLCGALTGLTGGLPWGVDSFSYNLIGTLFMNGLKMIAVPLVMISIIVGLSELGDRPGFGRLGGKTLLYYVTTSLIAVIIGLVLVNTIQPGAGSSLTPEEISSVVQSGEQEQDKMKFLETRTDGKTLADSANVLQELMPKNLFAAMAESKMIGLIVVSLLLGFFTARLPTEHKQVLLPVWKSLNALILKVTNFILLFLPIGVLALIAKTTSDVVANDRVGELLLQLGAFVVTVLAALGTHWIVTMSLLLLLVARVKPWLHYQAMAPALMGAFSSASSAGTLPITMANVRERAGVSERVTSFVLPVGATVNMDGTALYECVVVMFLAQLYGIELTFAMQFWVVFLALLTSIGVAGIPSASLVAITLILTTVNGMLPEGQTIPLEALGLILIVDRLLDMCRTAVNVCGDSCGAVIVARSEGEETALLGVTQKT